MPLTPKHLAGGFLALIGVAIVVGLVAVYRERAPYFVPDTKIDIYQQARTEARARMLDAHVSTTDRLAGIEYQLALIRIDQAEENHQRP